MQHCPTCPSIRHTDPPLQFQLYCIGVCGGWRGWRGGRCSLQPLSFPLLPWIKGAWSSSVLQAPVRSVSLPDVEWWQVEGSLTAWCYPIFQSTLFRDRLRDLCLPGAILFFSPLYLGTGWGISNCLPGGILFFSPLYLWTGWGISNCLPGGILFFSPLYLGTGWGISNCLPGAILFFSPLYLRTDPHYRITLPIYNLIFC
jgi:hypothetical protein